MHRKTDMLKFYRLASNINSYSTWENGFRRALNLPGAVIVLLKWFETSGVIHRFIATALFRMIKE